MEKKQIYPKTKTTAVTSTYVKNDGTPINVQELLDTLKDSVTWEDPSLGAITISGLSLSGEPGKQITTADTKDSNKIKITATATLTPADCGGVDTTKNNSCVVKVTGYKKSGSSFVEEEKSITLSQSGNSFTGTAVLDEHWYLNPDKNVAVSITTGGAVYTLASTSVQTKAVTFNGKDIGMKETGTGKVFAKALAFALSSSYTDGKIPQTATRNCFYGAYGNGTAEEVRTAFNGNTGTSAILRSLTSFTSSQSSKSVGGKATAIIAVPSGKSVSKIVDSFGAVYVQNSATQVSSTKKYTGITCEGDNGLASVNTYTVYVIEVNNGSLTISITIA